MAMSKLSLLSRIRSQYTKVFEDLKPSSCLPGDLFLLTEDRFEAAMEFLSAHYLTDEPCSKSGGQQLTNDVKHYWFQRPFSFGLSVIVLKPGTDEIIAIQVIDTESKHEDHAVDEITDEALRQTSTLMNRVEEGYNIFEDLGVDEVIRFQHLSVDESYRNQGIATKLIAFCNNVLSQLDIKPYYAKVLCTSNYSLKVFEKNGFKVVNNIRYDEYFVDGKMVFSDMGEHKSIRYLVKQIA